MLLALLTLCSATLAPAPAATVVAGHGRLDWFEGSFDEALARARAEDRIVFLDFWAEWCGWCKRLDHDVFSDASVVAEMKPLLCYSIDKDSAQGAAIAKRFAVNGLPTLIFLAPNGEVLDTIVGYEPALDFLADVQRIKRGEGTLPALRKRLAEHPDDIFARFDLATKLQASGSPDAAAALNELRARIQRGEGFDTDSIDDHWQLVRRFKALGDEPAAERHVERIEELDPERRSLPLRLVDLEGERVRAEQGYSRTGTLDVRPLEAFLASEPHAEIRFQGWMIARRYHRHLAEEARKHGSPAEQIEHLDDARRAEREAWKDVPPEHVASFGHDLAWLWYISDGLEQEERAFAVEVAQRASEAAPQSVKHIDTLACCLDAAGRRDEALAVLGRALVIQPNDPKLIGRRLEFSR